jgi:3-oxoadipate enol-lactonase
MAFAKINGQVLHYEFLTESKDDPVVVLINSLGTDFRIWLPFMDEIAEEWSFLLYDKRGHGLSETGATPYSISDHAKDLIGLLDHLKIKKAVLVGLSVGGLIAQEIWRQRPALIEKIVLCDTAHKIGTVDGWNQRIAGVTEKGIASLADGVMTLWFTPDFHTKRADELAGYKTMLTRQSVEGYAATCAAIRDADFTTVAPTISVPVLAVVGDQDGSTPPDLVRSTAALIPDAQFEIIEGCGHIPCVEQPTALAELIIDFINED